MNTNITEAEASRTEPKASAGPAIEGSPEISTVEPAPAERQEANALPEREWSPAMKAMYYWVLSRF